MPKLAIVLLTIVFIIATGHCYDAHAADAYWSMAQLSYCEPSVIEQMSGPASDDIKRFAPGIEFDAVITHETHNLQAYVMHRITPNDDDLVFYIVYRGTVSSSLSNWLTDLDFVKSAATWEGGAKVHEGFLGSFETLRPGILSAIHSVVRKHLNVDEMRFVIVGHSLGAALATLNAVDWKVNQFKTNHITLYTFGCPRVGDSVFADLVNDRVEVHNRLTHNRDIVPHLPFKCNCLHFRHAGTEVFYDKPFEVFKVCDGSGEDETCSDQFSVTLSIEDHTHYFGRVNNGGCVDQ